jgi:predicted proteasome-type protease
MCVSVKSRRGEEKFLPRIYTNKEIDIYSAYRRVHNFIASGETVLYAAISGMEIT